MHPLIKIPVKRRRTIETIPHLAEYIVEGEKLTRLRIGLDPLSKYLLQRLLVQDDLARSTWHSQLAYRLISEKKLEARIHRYAEDMYPHVPMLGEAPILITIPKQLQKVLSDAAEDGPFMDKRGPLSIWLRAAICYVALEENGIAFSSLPMHLRQYQA